MWAIDKTSPIGNGSEIVGGRRHKVHKCCRISPNKGVSLKTEFTQPSPRCSQTDSSPMILPQKLAYTLMSNTQQKIHHDSFGFKFLPFQCLSHCSAVDLVVYGVMSRRMTAPVRMSWTVDPRLLYIQVVESGRLMHCMGRTVNAVYCF